MHTRPSTTLIIIIIVIVVLIIWVNTDKNMSTMRIIYTSC